MLPISLSAGFDDRMDVSDLMDFLALRTVEPELLLLIQSDRIIGKQAEQTPIQGSTAVHIPASTYSPFAHVSSLANDMY